jgi:glycosyltransferase involved in cell wall biosynthesis
MDVYLVDDLEESARLIGSPGLARLFRWVEPRLLRRASRVFAISPGYCKHLRDKYRINAEWLPIPVESSAVVYSPYPQKPEGLRRVLVFLGAVNQLYIGGLRTLLKVIDDWNAPSSSEPPLQLLLLTYNSPAYIKHELGDDPNLTIARNLSTAERMNVLRECWAVFVPYSFSTQVRVMVSTSFPTKFTETLICGRPVVVYGPAEASVPRYFSENNLPLSACTPEGLKQVLQELPARDTPDLIDAYRRLLREMHSSQSLQSRLAIRSR